MSDYDPAIDNGERFLPCGQHGVIELEHLHRYALAALLATGKHVLDIACGEGYGSAMLAACAASVRGVDISENVIRHASKKYPMPNLEFIPADCGRRLPFEDHVFDLIVSFETIEHHDRHEFMLEEFKRVLKPDGVVIISSPDRDVFKAAPGSAAYHVKELSSGEFKILIESCFRNVRFLGQKVVYGSLIMPYGKVESEATCFACDSEGTVSRSPVKNPFNIIIASNAELENCRYGLLERDINSSEFVQCWKDQFTNASAHIQALSSGYNDIAAQLEECRHSNYEYNTRLVEKDQRINCLENEFASLNDSQSSLRQEISVLRELNTVHEQTIVSKDNHISALQKLTERHVNDLDSATVKIRERQGAVSLLRQYAKDLENELDNLSERLSDLQRQHRECEERRKQTEAQCADLRRQRDMLRDGINMMQDSKIWKSGKILRFMYLLMTLRKRDLAPEMPVAWRGVNSALLRFKVKYPGCYNVALRHPHSLMEKWLKPAGKRLHQLCAASVIKPSTPQQHIPLHPQYISEYQDDMDFSAYHGDIKAIAFFLPQFHTIPENDEWWGKGFTEWTNTRKSRPRFPHHFQPRTPHKDIGYYDLSKVETLKRQAEMARKHGIYGFCIYYYWFDGKLLLETPLKLLLAHPEIEMNFCLCWANENWTKAWDGMAHSILIKQDYSVENDIRFIEGIRDAFMDKRYIRIGGKPLLLIYRAIDLPDPRATFQRWRSWCRDHGVGEIEIWSVKANFSSDGNTGLSGIADRELEFPPHRIAKLRQIPGHELGFDNNNGHFYDYRGLVNDVLNFKTFADQSPLPLVRTAMLGWDNSARRKDGWSVWHGFSLERFYMWMRHIIRYTRESFPESERVVFINAWNEWAEGTYLEPDEKYGYAALNTASKALFDLPLKDGDSDKTGNKTGKRPKPAALIHAHVFYPDLMEELVRQLNFMPIPYDLIVTTDTGHKKETIRGLLKNCTASKIIVRICPNRGRDIGPFMVECRNLLSGYDYICHVHTKRSTTVDWGDHWRKYLWNNLFGSKDNLNGIFHNFNINRQLGMIFPPTYPVIAPHCNWGGIKERCAGILKRAGLNSELPDTPVFPAGNMFWARTDAIAPLFRLNHSYGDFEEENGQIGDTLAHAIERIWTYICQGGNYSVMSALDTSVRSAECRKLKRLAIFAHYDRNHRLSPADMHFLEHLRPLVQDILMVSNSPVPEQFLPALRRLNIKLIIRDNSGFDFGAWRDGINSIGYERIGEYDELVLANNSCYAHLFQLTEMFAAMDERECDFWGVSDFPEMRDSARPEAKLMKDGIIPYHLQSYFTVFRKNVLNSEAFRDFWHNVKDLDQLIDVVVNYETGMSRKLMLAGFKPDAYIRESCALQLTRAHDPAFNAIYNVPADFIKLRSPFLKKNILYCLDHNAIAEVKHMVETMTFYPPELLSNEKRL